MTFEKWLAPFDSLLIPHTALAYLAKHDTECTRAELVPILGLSRPESVPDLSSRFAALLRTQASVRRDLVAWNWPSKIARKL